ncbi:ferritin [Sorangium cellulosum]|uniref:Ferritin n=1 Tax=Sorangium cellulosum TaxID=56 RepID=A0A4P2PZF4_SORCE|nr:PA2169 family four-helix-bundle protein [Sorangium cellulosum]AUX21883.1 ferritin [Sorangium cellulosum]
MARDVIEVLNDLIQLDRDAIAAYDQAVEACERASVREPLARFRDDHARHVTDLSALVTSLGGAPAQTRDLKGKLIEGFTAITSFGDQSALLAMRGNEELTNRKYEAALNEALTVEARAVVERNRADEQRHLAWIKDALSRKVWEQAA